MFKIVGWQTDVYNNTIWISGNTFSSCWGVFGFAEINSTDSYI